MILNEKFGLFVELFITCLIDIIPFVVFLVIWLCTFTLVYSVIGANGSESSGDFPSVDKKTAYFLSTWENAIGNINPPSFDFWQNIIDKAPESDQFSRTVAQAVIYVIWFIWF